MLRGSVNNRYWPDVVEEVSLVIQSCFLLVLWVLFAVSVRSVFAKLAVFVAYDAVVAKLELTAFKTYEAVVAVPCKDPVNDAA